MSTNEKTQKDFFDKLSSLSGVFIAIAGFTATYLYNNNQLKIEETKTEVELMEKCMKYIISTNPQEREFGYQVFVINGHEDLALKLISIKGDSAGVKIIKNIVSDEKSEFRPEAKLVLNQFENAKTLEINGFQFLLEKDINNAITSFKNSEKSYPSYHQVYEISRYLEKNKTKLQDKNSEAWQTVYMKILKEYSWGMPNDIKIKLTEETR